MTIMYPYNIDSENYGYVDVTFDLSEEDIKMIDEICKATGERRSVAITRILKEYLERQTN
jgi:metal-responsive CopG/Arc/MetJ family transcriptional regulator